MKLRPLAFTDEAQALMGHSELAQENWEYLLNYNAGMSWIEYLAILDDEHTGRNLSQGGILKNRVEYEDTLKRRYCIK